MLRKAMVEQQLDILLQSTERLKSSIVIPQEPGEKGTDYNVIVSQLQKIESQIESIVNLIQLEDD
jgi:hypothetical protein|tara:strand:- start:144 stop:338 length:195 start_codon:yes stop_codon:yes gene_type:complete